QGPFAGALPHRAGARDAATGQRGSCQRRPASARLADPDRGRATPRPARPAGGGRPIGRTGACLSGQSPLYPAASPRRPAKWHAVAVFERVRNGPHTTQGCKMPKMKTKSGAKKRFKMTATGKVKVGVAGKRHRLISHNADYIRSNRGTKVLSKGDEGLVKWYMPYNR